MRPDSLTDAKVRRTSADVCAPGMRRDIVSFGLVGSVTVRLGHVHVAPADPEGEVPRAFVGIAQAATPAPKMATESVGGWPLAPERAPEAAASAGAMSGPDGSAGSEGGRDRARERVASYDGIGAKRERKEAGV